MIDRDDGIYRGAAKRPLYNGGLIAMKIGGTYVIEADYSMEVEGTILNQTWSPFFSLPLQSFILLEGAVAGLAATSTALIASLLI